MLREGRGVPLSDVRGTPPSKGLGTPPNEGLGTPPNEGLGTPPNDGLGTPPNEGLGTPSNEGLGVPISKPSPAPLTFTTPADPNSTDPILDALEYVLKRESEGGYFLGVSGSGGSDLSMLHNDGVGERDGDGGCMVWFEGLVSDRLRVEESGIGGEEKGMGLWGVAGYGRDNEDVEAVLEPVPFPTPVPSPLELDPALSRKSARVGVTPSIPKSSSKGTLGGLDSLGL